MKKEQIKALPLVNDFINYFSRRAKRVLKIKNSEFRNLSIDIDPDPKRMTIWVWFYISEKVIARVQFYFNGRCFKKTDYRT